MSESWRSRPNPCSTTRLWTATACGDYTRSSLYGISDQVYMPQLHFGMTIWYDCGEHRASEGWWDPTWLPLKKNTRPTHRRTLYHILVFGLSVFIYLYPCQSHPLCMKDHLGLGGETSAKMLVLLSLWRARPSIWFLGQRCCVVKILINSGFDRRPVPAECIGNA